ncbi:unnamed protein product [marine sediment metagenome]|uniref:Uncharacterized protein n=1 Tax=marine sediment metagenome TaxID=412755 RepID=X1U5R7_9ZZZZ
MDYELDSRLQKLIGEHKINLMSSRGLLEISVATIEAVKAHLIACGPYDDYILSAMDTTSDKLRTSR